jgi:hypothetical protein
MPTRTRSKRAVAAVAAMLVGAVACGGGYTPRLGELMSFNQLRHAKLWYAGHGGNWALARYELDELQAQLDAIVELYPTVQGSTDTLTALMPRIMSAPMEGVRAAIEARDPEGFSGAFDKLTAGCNACHQAAGRGFNVIKRPDGTAWYANQDFSAP